MKIITASQKHSHGNNIFHVDILYPGEALGSTDSGFYTIGRIDHASFRPPGVVPMHPHRDDEILSYMRSGLQTHKDSDGNTELISPSRLMMMNAGSGIQHEEIAEEPVEMLQIFMRPFRNGLKPQVQFHTFDHIYSEDGWRLVAGSAAGAPLELRTDTNILDARIGKDQQINLPATDDPVLYFLYCFAGNVSVGGDVLTKGDSVILQNEMPVIHALEESDLVLFQIGVTAAYSETGMYSGNKFRSMK